MRTIIFKETISYESIKGLISDIESKTSNAYDRNIRIYFSSIGGCAASASIFIHFLNTRTDFNIELIGFWELHSATMDIFMKSKVKKKLMPNAWCIAHLYTRELYMRDLRDKDSVVNYLKKDIDKLNVVLLKSLTKFLTKKELLKVKSGGEVILNRSRILKMIKS